jgi:hypothetical protein
MRLLMLLLIAAPVLADASLAKPSAKKTTKSVQAIAPPM